MPSGLRLEIKVEYYKDAVNCEPCYTASFALIIDHTKKYEPEDRRDFYWISGSGKSPAEAIQKLLENEKSKFLFEEK